MLMRRDERKGNKKNKKATEQKVSEPQADVSAAQEIDKDMAVIKLHYIRNCCFVYLLTFPTPFVLFCRYLPA